MKTRDEIQDELRHELNKRAGDLPAQLKMGLQLVMEQVLDIRDSLNK